MKRVLLAGAALAALASAPAYATPMYAARAGRTCDNCHVTPNDWRNPKLAARKCGLSCQTCHVDPAGGGMRNASGRFYGRATLPMIATSPRPTADWDRGVPGLGRRDRATTYSHRLPLGPDTFEASATYRDSTADGWAWGTPAGGATPYGFFPGRYDALAADPVLRITGEVRLAALLSRSSLFFPMQFDVSTALHPVHHVTAFANVGVRGRASGYGDTFDDNHTPYFREAFVLLHEAPFNSYVKGGRFVPSYGLRLDDHTSRIRREFELDGSLPESRVTGVEVGAAPNYPFVQAAYFRMASRARVPDPWDIFDVDEGWGVALNAGYRNEGWTLAASALARRRPLEEGGDTDTYGVYAAINPWHYARSLPLTYQVEYDIGSRQRASGTQANLSAFYHELDWLVWNGVNVLIAHDWSDPDHEVRDDDTHRVQGGVQIVPYPGVSVDARVRALLLPRGEGSDADVFLQLHLWN
jgi:hypothetical protein